MLFIHEFGTFIQSVIHNSGENIESSKLWSWFGMGLYLMFDDVPNVLGHIIYPTKGFTTNNTIQLSSIYWWRGC